MKLSKRRRGGTGVGVIAGIVGSFLLLALVFGVMMMVMGRCPICGNMMQ